MDLMLPTWNELDGSEDMVTKQTIDLCNFFKILPSVSETLMRNDQAAVMEHLATKGPLGIALDASVFHQYQGGIFEECDYDKNIEINHGVQLVGYGENPEEGKFWIIRNSWYHFT